MRVGITGGMGSGKTILSKLLISYGYPVFNSDTAAKKMVASNQKVKVQIQALLGPESYLGGEYNKEFVAKEIFSSDSLREQLNQIIHPAVRRAYDDFSSQYKVSFNEAAILFETGAYKSFDKIILMTSPVELRLKRLLNRQDGLSQEQILARIANQWSDEQKIPLADFVLNNDENSSLILQLEGVLSKLITP